MANTYQRQPGSGPDDPLGLLARMPHRSPLQELRDYPFFAPEDDVPPPAFLLRHGDTLLLVLALVAALEAVVLGLLLR